MTNDQAHWLAGLFEGEGSFFPGPPSEPGLPIAKVEMCDRDVIERAADLLEVASPQTISRPDHPEYKMAFRLVLKGSRAVDFMRTIQPLMGIARAAQIEKALASYRAGHRRYPTSTGLCELPGCASPVKGRRMCRRHYNAWWKRRRRKKIQDESWEPLVELVLTPEAEIHWLAGLVEGEGNFAAPPPSAPLSPAVTLSMCERDVVERAARLMGAPRPFFRQDPRNPRWRPSYTARVSARKAVALMETLRPFMGARRQKEIDRALSFARPAYSRLIPAPARCIADGCEDKPRGRGLCHKHYMSWLRHAGSSAVKESRKSGANLK